MELSDYLLETLREDEKFILYRGNARDMEAPSVLLLAPSSTRPAPESLKKIEHDYSLRTELDAAWAARPLAVSQYKEQPVLVLPRPSVYPAGAWRQRVNARASQAGPRHTRPGGDELDRRRPPGAAARLGMKRTTLQSYMKRLAIERRV